MVKLGSRVKDSVSGFKGIAVCRSEFLFGCVRIGVQPENTDKEGKHLDSVWFDEDQLVTIREGVHEGVKPKSKPTTGGFGDPQTPPAPPENEGFTQL